MHRRRNVPGPCRAILSAIGPARLAASLLLALGGLAWLTVPRAALAQTPSDSSVVLQWTAPGDDGNVGRATSYDLRYRNTPITGTDTLTWWNGATQVTGEPIPSTAGAADSMRVRGLIPLTTYYFIIKAGDEVPNWSGYSNVATKTTTGDNTPPAAITTLAVTGVTANSISVRWTAPGNDGSTGTAASYDIRYSTSAITSANFASATQASGEPTPAVAGTQQSFTLGGLTVNQTYFIAMKATDGSGNVSLLSNVVSGTPADTIAPSPVRDLSLLDWKARTLQTLARVLDLEREPHDS